MIEYEDECVGCPLEMGCMGESCPYKNVPHYYCDRCGKEIDEEEPSTYDGEYLCRDCAHKYYPDEEE